MRFSIPGVVVGMICAFLLNSSAALGDDLVAPPWQRGADGTTWQMWEFSTDVPDTLPDQMYNPYGSNPPIAHAYPGQGQSWVDVWGGRQGIWPLSGTMEIEIPNRPEPLPYKTIWIQVTWAKQVSGSFAAASELLTGTPATIVQETVIGPTNEPTLYGNWYHTVFQIDLEPNPDFEVVKISGTILVDEVVVDTICFPEPASLSLLAFGSLALLRRKR